MKLGIGVTSYVTLANLRENALDSSRQDLEFIRTIIPANYEYMINLFPKSMSQFRQDLFVLSETNYKQKGYFVEFGGADGIYLSNTYLLETEFSWTGIIAEPARVFEKNLKANRPIVCIETLCVWKESNLSLMFNETKVPVLSTINKLSHLDNQKDNRRAGNKYQVQTISLIDMLKKYRAPKYIDYLSVDTEGSEYEILNAFDFNEYDIRIISVEHNYTDSRELIFDLLTSKGYKRKYQNISHCDDWYVKI